MKALICLGGVLLLFTMPARAEELKWTIHEWGTFTSLQNESGDAIGGINSDDEPVPEVVHRLAYFLLLQPTEIPYSFCQGAPACHPDVTMRLETPVIYFHPPASQAKIQNANVVVKFRGGWLTEYYPDAKPTAEGLRPSGYNTTNMYGEFLRMGFGHLNSDTESKLEWNDLEIGGNGSFPNTTAHVWTSPRAVQAASVQTRNQESERFLFYRGVAHIDAPLKIARDKNTGELLFRSQLKDLSLSRPLTLNSLWLVDIRANGMIAFRALPSISLDQKSKKILAHTAAEFESKDFNSSNLDKLKTSLRTALIAEGLFTDEADALLNTWELSYFKSAGLRVFFLVPRAWTDHYLPLDISLPSDINRVMVGRIELITPEQRQKLATISQLSPTKVQTEFERMRTDYYAKSAGKPGQWDRLWNEKKPLSADIPIPHTYQTFLDLGRFRHALVLDEAKRHPTPGLTNFISAYRLAAYIPLDKMPVDGPTAMKIFKSGTE